MTYRYLDVFTAEMNDGNHVFVFGSNLAGIHGAGAARTAAQEWGALTGYGLGRQGDSYAIPTKGSWRDTHSFPLGWISIYVKAFLLHANQHPKITFLVTPIGTGFAGLSHAQVAPMFRGSPPNCIFVNAWKEYLEEANQ